MQRVDRVDEETLKPGELVGPMRLPASINKKYQELRKAQRNRQLGHTKHRPWRKVRVW